MTWVERTAYPRLPRTVSARELVDGFTPTGEEVAWARRRTQSEQHLLALVTFLKCYQHLGYFPRLAAVPMVVVEHLRRVCGLSATVVAVHEVDRTGKRHRDYVRDRLGVVYEPARVRAVAEAVMREALLSKDNPADVINVALEELAKVRCELPGYSTLDEMASSLRAEVNGGFYRLVADRLDAAVRIRLVELLIVDPLSRRSGLVKLTAAAPKATVSRLKQHVALLCWLDGLGPTEEWLDGIPPAKIARFAGEAAVLDADELAGVGQDKRLTLLACLIHTARTRARDEVVTMFCSSLRGSSRLAARPSGGAWCGRPGDDPGTGRTRSIRWLEIREGARQ
jgi:hypothetical protein